VGNPDNERQYRIARTNAIVCPAIAAFNAFQAYTNFNGAGFGGPGGVMWAVLAAAFLVLGLLYLRRALHGNGR
jgi:hypothetical protein